MMKLFGGLNTKRASMNLTPMIDVVFLLIIFFIVSSNLIQQDVTVPVELPDAQTGKIEENNKTKQLTLNIPQPGQLLAGTVPVTKENLRRLLSPGKNDAEFNSIRIRTGKDVPYGEIETILTLAAEKGITDVSFAVKE